MKMKKDEISVSFFCRERGTGKPYVNVLCDYNEDINNSYFKTIHSLLTTTLPGISSDGGNNK